MKIIPDQRPPRAPIGLSKPAKREWARVLAELIAGGGLLPPATLMIEYIEAWELALSAKVIIDREGISTFSKSGEQKMRPESIIYHREKQLMLAYLKEMGLTPNSRRRVPSGDRPKQGDEAEELLND